MSQLVTVVMLRGEVEGGGKSSEWSGGERGRKRLVCSRARQTGSACEGGEGHANHASSRSTPLGGRILEGAESVQRGWESFGAIVPALREG